MAVFHSNYAFLFYDVGEKRVQKIFKICKKYLYPYQNSVFRGPITPSKLIQLKRELKAKMDEDHDFVSILLLKNERDFREETIGQKNNQDPEDLFL
ncbi:CRISPR-associated endonuclease Cas2 [Sporolactobacillus sp. Y61]|uniref:CRISPR-associated endoribonuclease Cas2 n=1 Tax=Sporolactobacillus sp. Y61 TaxID=3160863 RepID=A0AAU8IJ15_9BACL